MSQSSILVEDGGNGSHNPHEDVVRGCETEAEDPELVRPFFFFAPRSEDNDANRDE